MNNIALLYLSALPSDVMDRSSEELAASMDCHWRLPVTSTIESDDGQPWHSGNLTQAAKQLQGDAELWVIVPALHGLLTSIEVNKKQRRHLQQVLPFMVEEKLATDIENMHLCGTDVSATHLAVVAVREVWIRSLMDLLQSLQLSPQRLMFNVDLLAPYVDDVSTHVLCLHGDVALLLNGSYQALSFERSADGGQLFEFLQQQEINNLIVLAEPSCLSTEESLALEQWRAQVTVSFELIELAATDSPLADEICRDLDPSAAVMRNLLQGAYTPLRQRASQSWRWQPLALVASVLLVLNVGYLITSGLFLNRQAQQYRQAAEQQYRQYFPADRRIINIRTQTKNHLAGDQNSQPQGFFTALSRFVDVWQQQPPQALEVRSLRYRQKGQELLLDLESQTIAQLDQVQRQLREHGVTADLLSANEDGDGVRGRIKIQGAL